MIGQILNNRYQIQKQLGKKTGRRTFLSKDLTTENLVVIKLLIFSIDFEWDDLKFFEREAATLQNINYESIPKYLDYFEIDEKNYKEFALVQSYIDAKTLEEYLIEGRSFTEKEIKELTRAILEILIYLHAQNPPIIHRDIKPSNILLANRSGHRIGDIYLVDFGSVQSIASQESGTITIVGTYGYMPPEQFGGRTVPASDLYSLGATLIYLATGNHPADLPQKEGRIQFESLVSLSPAFSDWIRRSIEPNLDSRFLSAEEALEKLENLHQFQIASSTIQKPANSRIILNKDARKIQIIFSRQKLDKNFIHEVSQMGYLFNFLLFYIVGFFITPGLPWFFLLFISPFLISWLLTLSKSVLTLSSQIILSIDEQKISLIDRAFKISFIRKTSLREHINLLQKTKVVFHTDAEEIRINMIPALIIWSGTQDYEISKRFIKYITVPELEWLASELSEWLGLPITRKD